MPLRNAGFAAALLIALGHFGLADVARAQDPILAGGDVIVTGFSGIVWPDPANPLPAGKTVTDLTFIDTEGPSARFFDLRQAAGAGDPLAAQVFEAEPVLDVKAVDVGQVFGIARDDAENPNIYLTATSAFGLNIVLPGKSRDAPPERITAGAPRAVWMEGQFGLDLYGGPGSIWKIDGLTGEVSLFANVTLSGVPNPGPALGNIAYDAGHKQLFVSDLYTGMIHRFDLDGADLEHFDHGVDGRVATGFDPVPFDPSIRPDLANPGFSTNDPATWGHSPPERRVWGLTVDNGRLYYAVADGPQIWSVGIAEDGSFAGDPRWEFDLPAEDAAYQVSDMVFAPGGALILAERAPIAASYDYSAFTLPGAPRVLAFWREDPDDPATPSRWFEVSGEYPVGFPNNSRNSAGGVALGYGTNAEGRLDFGACDAGLWTMGDRLRNEPELEPYLQPGGPLLVDGVQVIPAENLRDENTPPWISGYLDYDGRFDDLTATGHVGDLSVVSGPCAGLPGKVGGPPPVRPPCADCAPPPPPPVASICIAGEARLVCDHKTGTWTYELSVSEPIWASAVTAVSLTPGFSVPGGPIALNPAGIALTGAPGTAATIEICAFDAVKAASGEPYDCCRAEIAVTIPAGICEVEK